MVVCGVLPIDGGVVVLLASAQEDPRVVAVSLDPVLTGAPTELATALAELDAPPAAFSGGVSRRRGPAAPEPSVKLDPSRTMFGLGAQPTAAAVGVAPTRAPAAVVAEEEGGFPWLAVGAGAGVVILGAAAATVAAVYFLQPAPEAEKIQDPDRLTLSIGVAP